MDFSVDPRVQTSIEDAHNQRSQHIRGADPEEGIAMFHQRTADAAERYGLEHHFPIGWALAAGLVGAGNITATVLMLLAQA